MIEENPQDFAGETELLSFHANQQNTKIELQYQIRKKRKDYHTLAAHEMAMLEDITAQYTVLKENLDTVEDAINTTIGHLEKEELKAQKIDLLAAWQNLDNQFKTITTNFTTERIQIVQEGFQLVQSFPAIAIHEIYFKEVYTIYFNRILQGGHLEESQIASLITIGQECPLDFGNIIDMARGMIPLCRRPYFDESDCMPEIEEEEELPVDPIAPRIKKEDKNWTISPNPNNGTFTVEDIPSNTRLLLLDIHGKIIREENVVEQSTVQIKTLSPGIYILKIQRRSGEIYTKKIIVAH